MPDVAIAPFAALMRETNAVVMQALPNAIAVVNGDEPFGVIFEMPYADGYGAVVDGRSPVCTGPAAQLAGLERDGEIVIDGQLYVVDSAEPDGDGFIKLALIKGDA
ncbi:MAG: hypothetical protein RSD57_13675 [Comamonas sp.]